MSNLTLNGRAPFWTLINHGGGGLCLVARVDGSKQMKDFWGIVPFVATPIKGRFVFCLQKLLKGYFRLGDSPVGLGNWPRTG